MNIPVLFLSYILLEAAAFWAVVTVFGIGWAFAGLGLLFIIGMILAFLEMRSVTARAQAGQEKAGALIGDNGLIMLGSLLLALPGFVSTVVGLLLIFGPTRLLIRHSIARRLQERIDEFAYQVYSQAHSMQGNMQGDFLGFPGGGSNGGQAASGSRFGGFGGSKTSESVIDGADIEKWERENDWDEGDTK